MNGHGYSLVVTITLPNTRAGQHCLPLALPASPPLLCSLLLASSFSAFASSCFLFPSRFSSFVSSRLKLPQVSRFPSLMRTPREEYREKLCTGLRSYNTQRILK